MSRARGAWSERVIGAYRITSALEEKGGVLLLEGVRIASGRAVTVIVFPGWTDGDRPRLRRRLSQSLREVKVLDVFIEAGSLLVVLEGRHGLDDAVVKDLTALVEGSRESTKRFTSAERDQILRAAEAQQEVADLDAGDEERKPSKDAKEGRVSPPAPKSLARRREAPPAEQPAPAEPEPATCEEVSLGDAERAEDDAGPAFAGGAVPPDLPTTGADAPMDRAIAPPPPPPGAPPQPAPMPMPPPGGPAKTDAPLFQAPAEPPRMMMTESMAPPMRSRSSGLGGVAAAAAGAAAGAVVGTAAALGRAAQGAKRKASPSAPAAMDGSEALAETMDRRATVRHYSQMNPGRTFPLLVVISEGRIEKVKIQGVVQTESKQTFAVKKENPYVRIEPVLSGCAVSPTAIDLDVSRKVAEAKFWVSPIAEGEVPDARVEIRYEGKLVDSVGLKTAVRRQTAAKASAALSVISPLITKLVPVLTGKDAAVVAQEGALGAFGRLSESAGGHFMLGLWFTGALAVVALLFYLRNRAKEAEPVVHFFDYATAGRTTGAIDVERRKQHVVVLAPHSSWDESLTDREVTIGSDPGSSLCIPDASVDRRHARLIFDGHAFVLRREERAGQVRLEQVPIDEAILPDREALIEIGAVTLWAYRAVKDEGLEAARAAIVQRLCERLPQHVKAIRAAFQDPRATVLEAAARLMVEGALDPTIFREVLARVAAGAPA